MSEPALDSPVVLAKFEYSNGGLVIRYLGHHLLGMSVNVKLLTIQSEFGFASPTVGQLHGEYAYHRLERINQC
jgi:hypothetical protein